jgi:hypothetical protein
MQGVGVIAQVSQMFPRITKDRMTGVLGLAPKPKSVWQKQFDHNDETLKQLARCTWDSVPECDLWEYFHDLAYMELQPDLFRHVFPACLKFWYDTLFRNEGAERGDADFHRSLMRGNILIKMMTEAERHRLLNYFVDGLLDRIDLERGYELKRNRDGANALIGRFNTLGIIAPIIPQIWTSWWQVDTPGKATAAIKYASGLVYFKGENPIYLPWTPDEGGGGPYLTEWDASIFDHAWLDTNLSFLEETLTCDYLLDRLTCAANQLAGEPEGPIARRIAVEAKERTDTISLRTEDLLLNLAKLTLEKDLWD